MQLGQEEEALARQTEVGPLSFSWEILAKGGRLTNKHIDNLSRGIIMTSNGMQLTTNHMIFGCVSK